jgi:hypothetical protein
MQGREGDLPRRPRPSAIGTTRDAIDSGNDYEVPGKVATIPPIGATSCSEPTSGRYLERKKRQALPFDAVHDAGYVLVRFPYRVLVGYYGVAVGI